MINRVAILEARLEELNRELAETRRFVTALQGLVGNEVAQQHISQWLSKGRVAGGYDGK